MDSLELLKAIGQAEAEHSSELSLIECEITALPPEIGVLRDLTSLVLPMNKLTCLPPEIGQLAKLTSLLLCDNKLEHLPDEIASLTQLRK